MKLPNFWGLSPRLLLIVAGPLLWFGYELGRAYGLGSVPLFVVIALLVGRALAWISEREVPRA